MRPTPDTIRLNIQGMSCASCAQRVEKALRRVEGVREARVNLATATATVTGAVPVEKLCAAVTAAGYGAALAAGRKGAEDERRPAFLRFVVAAILSAPVAVIGMLMLHFRGAGPAQLALTTAVLAWPGRAFFVTAARLLRRGAANMDTLIAMGSGAAYLYSIGALVGHGPLYFETAAVIVTLILLGRYLEARAKGRASSAIAKLASLQPRLARVVHEGGEAEVSAAEVRAGDVVLVRPGESIPVDGTVLEGASTANEAMITGESAPVEKGPGSRVIGASINGSGSLKVRAERVGAETVLAQMARLVEEAQGSKAPVQRLADRVAGVFVPVVILIALGVGGAWLAATGSFVRAMLPAVAVLVIACPCAMGLATPTAIMAGAGRAAEMGVIVRDAAALERTRALNAVVFDKTGTITCGHPAVTSVHNASGLTDESFLGLVAACERHSEHPLGEAVVRYARGRGVAMPEADGFTSSAGLGVRATVHGAQVLAGNERFLRDNGVEVGDAGGDGGARVFVAVDGKSAGWIEVSDPVKPGAAAAVAEMKSLGIEPVMLTGDRVHVAQAVAREVGIEKVGAGLLPEEKIAAIRSRQASGQVVGMVGDGVNDAPALAAADVGFAIGTGSDIAREAAPIVLIRGDLIKAVEAIRLGRRTMQIIRQNLFWAFAYNVAAIPLAALGVLNPMIAAAAMSASSVCVVFNSLRLRRFGRGGMKDEGGRGSR